MNFQLFPNHIQVVFVPNWVSAYALIANRLFAQTLQFSQNKNVDPQATNNNLLQTLTKGTIILRKKNWNCYQQQKNSSNKEIIMSHLTFYLYEILCLKLITK